MSPLVVPVIYHSCRCCGRLYTLRDWVAARPRQWPGWAVEQVECGTCGNSMTHEVNDASKEAAREFAAALGQISNLGGVA